MLPDFIEIKRQIEKSGNFGEPQDEILSQIQKTVINEGSRRTIYRADGSFETADFKRHSNGVNIDLQQVQTEGEAALERSRRELQERVTAEGRSEFFQFFAETVEEAGTAFNARGQPLSAELILQSYEKLEFTFDNKGRWRMPQPIFHSSLKPRFDHEWKRLHTEPELRQKMQKLIYRKKEEWDVQQANRKLVD